MYKIAPGQAKEPIEMCATPEWPFQKVCADYFHHKGHDQLTIVDRFSGWPCIYHFKAGTMNSMNLINICRDLFISYGAPVEFSFDGGLQFTAQVFQQFLQAWGIAHCLYLLVSRLFPIQWS